MSMSFLNIIAFVFDVFIFKPHIKQYISKSCKRDCSTPGDFANKTASSAYNKINSREYVIKIGINIVTASGYFPVILWIHHFLSSFGPQTYMFYIVISKSVLKRTRAESIVFQFRLTFSA